MHFYSQDDYNFYSRMTGTSGVIEQTSYDHNTNLTMKVKQSQNHTIIIWSWVAENGKWLLHIKNFLISRKMINF